MNKKGFTLVELLGVFSITAIILLITVPTVTNMLRKAKDNQYESFKEDIFLAAEAYIGVNHADFYELKSEGGQVYISLRDLMLSDYLKSTIVDPKTKKKVSEEPNYTVVVTTNSKKTFDYELKEQQIFHSYKVGDEITFDPGDGIVRTWNVISNSDINAPLVTIMMNENLGDAVAWNNTGANLTTPTTVLSALTTRTSKWKSDYLSGDIRLITREEYTTLKNNNAGITPTWMLVNLATTAGYWTSTASTSGSAYRISTATESVAVTNATTTGIRPVITIAKYK